MTAVRLIANCPARDGDRPDVACSFVHVGELAVLVANHTLRPSGRTIGLVELDRFAPHDILAG